MLAVAVFVRFVFCAFAVVAAGAVAVFLLVRAVGEDVFFVFVSGAAFAC